MCLRKYADFMQYVAVFWFWNDLFGEGGLLSAVWQVQINHMEITVDTGKSPGASYVV